MEEKDTTNDLKAIKRYSNYIHCSFILEIQTILEMKNKNKSVYGLIGRDISYSFSKDYFSRKFTKLYLKNHSYKNFDFKNIENLRLLLSNDIEQLKGLNVTIPYKEEVLKYLDEIDETAQKIGAVNTIKILKKYRLKGYNTDVYGFRESIKPLLQEHHKNALIMGTGGASKAIAYALENMHINYLFVSRNPKNDKAISYQEVTENVVKKFKLIINCTPLGTFPNIDNFPKIPYQYITKEHLLYDLIYNPAETVFLKKGKEKNAVIKNGLQMLELQAEKAWDIWNS